MILPGIPCDAGNKHAVDGLSRRQRCRQSRDAARRHIEEHVIDHRLDRHVIGRRCVRDEHRVVQRAAGLGNAGHIRRLGDEHRRRHVGHRDGGAVRVGHGAEIVIDTGGGHHVGVRIAGIARNKGGDRAAIGSTSRDRHRQNAVALSVEIEIDAVVEGVDRHRIDAGQVVDGEGEGDVAAGLGHGRRVGGLHYLDF